MSMRQDLGGLIISLLLVFSFEKRACAEDLPRVVQNGPGNSAILLPKGQLDVGVFSSTRYGLSERVEVGAHPLGMFILPSAHAAVNWFRDEETSPHLLLSTYHRLSLPTPFLHLVSKEGTGGFLPADTDVPFALQLETLALLTKRFGEKQVSVRLGIAVSLRERSELPMVEFPFLYSSLAPLISPFVLRGGLGWEGTWGGIFVFDVQYHVSLFRPQERISWPEGPAPWLLAQEVTGSIGAHWDLSHRVMLGGALAHARYPMGWRTHLFPTVDYRYNWL